MSSRAELPVLRVEGITHSFGSRTVLDSVDLEVAPGRVVGLLGPNGAGKTTLMRIIFGVLPPDEGTIRWGDRAVGGSETRSWGYMPQERGLYREMRVLDHLEWLARLHGLDKSDAADRARRLLDRLGLGDRASDAIKELSGGMAQRVQLAAAMVHDPSVLVLDEPFAGLDPAAVARLSEVIREHVDRGGALVFSSHQLDLVEGICESIVLLHRGRVVLSGLVDRLKAQSPDRYLRVSVPVDPAWLAGEHGHVESTDASGSSISLAPGADPAEVLDLVRAHGPVADFGVERPSLSELFLAATGEHHGGSTPGPSRASDRPEPEPESGSGSASPSGPETAWREGSSAQSDTGVAPS